MCGIAGIFGAGEINGTERVLESMLQGIAHRGPDGRGTVTFQRAGLGHVRLAIIDLSGGKQPMSSDQGGYHIVYNGELYNYKEIRKRLESKMVVFSSQSDTEVVLKAYQHQGANVLQNFRGMFAFAIWDEERQKGVLVRDRFGIKPLYYLEYGSQLIFGSEIKAILAVLTKKPEINLQSLHLLMNFRYIPGEETLFAGIRQLAPGCLLEWSEEKITLRKWAPNLPENDKASDLDRVRGLMRQAVMRQLESDVRVGAYLSGGIDSATVAYLASKAVRKFDLPTFTIQVGDSRNEADNAAATALSLHLQNFQEPVESDISEKLHFLIYHLEQPKVNALQTALVARLASRHVKVVLSGLGGDEIFLGYNIHSIMRLLQRGHTLSWGTSKVLGRACSRIFGALGMKAEEVQRGGAALAACPDYAVAYSIIRNVWDSPVKRNRIYGPVMLRQDFPDALEAVARKWARTDDPVVDAARFELENKMVNDLLLQEDRLSMAFGLEARVPFLDEDLVDDVWSISCRAKMRNGKKKQLMRDAVTPWLPSETIRRPKSGFQMPIHLMFQTHLRPLCDIYLNRERLNEDGLFNYDFVNAVIQEKPSVRLRWHYFLLYLMIGVKAWLDVFYRGVPIVEWK